MENNTSTKGGTGVAGLLLVAFIVLKLCHVIDWSWWWVLSPLWIPFGLGMLCAIFVAILNAFRD